MLLNQWTGFIPENKTQNNFFMPDIRTVTVFDVSGYHYPFKSIYGWFIHGVKDGNNIDHIHIYVQWIQHHVYKNKMMKADSWWC